VLPVRLFFPACLPAPQNRCGGRGVKRKKEKSVLGWEGETSRKALTFTFFPDLLIDSLLERINFHLAETTKRA